MTADRYQSLPDKTKEHLMGSTGKPKKSRLDCKLPDGPLVMHTSPGVMSLTVMECRDQGLSVIPQSLPNFDEHVHVVFPSSSSSSRRKRIAKRLRGLAVARGWRYRPSLE